MTQEVHDRILTLRSEGKSYRAIGAELGISPRTAAYHADPHRRDYALGNSSTHLKLARKFYWWVRRTHPEWINEFVYTL